MLKTGNLIAKRKSNYICAYMGSKWQFTEEAKMIDPKVNSAFWWGMATMNRYYDEPESRGARLIGIAMMLTMPDEIIEHKCVKLSKSKK